MIKLYISFDTIAKHKNLDSMKRYHASNYAIQLSEWCKDQGLIMGLDFEWLVSPSDENIIFKFMNKGEKYSSMFALKFGGGGREY